VSRARLAAWCWDRALDVLVPLAKGAAIAVVVIRLGAYLLAH
jgi:hypothetical protein